jgi:curli biogenesis system outer membrane secretion channel CsgG
MLAGVLAMGMLLQASPVTEGAKPAAVQAPANPGNDAELDPTALLKVKRIYVDSFGEDTVSRELQSMIVSALVSTKRFKVTENKEKADAVLKGVALEKTSQELHAYGESTAVGAASGHEHAEVSGGSGSASGGFIARHMGTSDSSVNTETVNEARVAVRLVNPDGDVIWTSTQESKGAKYKGSSADAADKCVKELLRDIEKLERASQPAPATQTPSTAPAQHK